MDHSLENSFIVCFEHLEEHQIPHHDDIQKAYMTKIIYITYVTV